MQFPRPRPTYANVAATLALVIAASMGGAYAHGKIGSALIKDNAVKSRHIAKANVTTSDIKGKAVTRSKLAPKARPNVIEYRLGAHNFAASVNACLDLGNLTRSQIRGSVWTAQLDGKFDAGNPTLDDVTYSVPGGGAFGSSQYRLFVQASDTYAVACVTRQAGPGEAYARVRVIRTIPTQSSPTAPIGARHQTP